MGATTQASKAKKKKKKNTHESREAANKVHSLRTSPRDITVTSIKTLLLVVVRMCSL